MQGCARVDRPSRERHGAMGALVLIGLSAMPMVQASVAYVTCQTVDIKDAKSLNDAFQAAINTPSTRRRRLGHGLGDPGAGRVLVGQLHAHVLGLGIELAYMGVRVRGFWCCHTHDAIVSVSSRRAHQHGRHERASWALTPAHKGQRATEGRSCALHSHPAA